MVEYARSGMVPDGERSISASTENIGQQRDFYALKEMSEVDLRCIEEVVIHRATDPRRQAFNRGWLPLFTKVFKARQILAATGGRDAGLERELRTAINNLEEDAHNRIEGAAVPLLALLRSGDSSFIRDESDRAIEFFLFLGLQQMRTPRTSKRLLPILRELGTVPSWSGFNAEAALGPLRWIFASNIGFSIFSCRKFLGITFFRAPPGAEFLTGDQPVVNTHAIEGEERLEVTRTNLYYPLSPKLAICFDLEGTDGVTGNVDASVAQVAMFNRMIVAASDRQVYSAKREVLLDLSPKMHEPASGRITKP